MGVEPTSQAWEARILPMYYARKSRLKVSLKLSFLRNLKLPIWFYFKLTKPQLLPKTTLEYLVESRLVQELCSPSSL